MQQLAQSVKQASGLPSIESNLPHLRKQKKNNCTREPQFLRNSETIEWRPLFNTLFLPPRGDGMFFCYQCRV